MTACGFAWTAHGEYVRSSKGSDGLAGSRCWPAASWWLDTALMVGVCSRRLGSARHWESDRVLAQAAAREGKREPTRRDREERLCCAGLGRKSVAGPLKKWPFRPGFRGVALSPCLSSGCSAGSAAAGWRPGKLRRRAGRQHGSGGLDAVGLSWTSWDMIKKVRRADQGFRGITDAGRTECGFHAMRNGESAGQRPFRWSGVTVCKTVGSAYVGSNPTPATTCGNGPWPAHTRDHGPPWRCPAVCHDVPLCAPA